VGWHLATYWCGEETTVDRHSDGDHETIDGDELPSWDEESAAWDEYYRDMVSTGCDPLGSVNIPVAPNKPHRWEFRFSRWIGSRTHGLRFLGARRRGRGRWIPLPDLPECIVDFLGLSDRNCLEGTGTIQELHKLPDVVPAVGRRSNKLQGQVFCTVEEPAKPWCDERIESFLKRAAKRHFFDKKTMVVK
jgi:hypothetical protein